MLPKRYLVIAGTYQQYRFWCRENHVDHVLDAKYVGERSDFVYGLDPANWTVVKYGTTWERTDLPAILDELRARGFGTPVGARDLSRRNRSL